MQSSQAGVVAVGVGADTGARVGSTTTGRRRISSAAGADERCTPPMCHFHQRSRARGMRRDSANSSGESSLA
jgi:hypothetical protein